MVKKGPEEVPPPGNFFPVFCKLF